MTDGFKNDIDNVISQKVNKKSNSCAYQDRMKCNMLFFENERSCIAKNYAAYQYYTALYI